MVIANALIAPSAALNRNSSSSKNHESSSTNHRRSSPSPARGRKALESYPIRSRESAVRHLDSWPTPSTPKASPTPGSTSVPLANLLNGNHPGQESSNNHAGSSVQVEEPTSLHELAHIIRLSKHQERKCLNVRTRLERTLISTGLNARLTRCGEIAHRNLVDTFRRDDKEGFACLYNAIQDVRKSCDELRRFALVEPDLAAQSSITLGSSDTIDQLASQRAATTYSGRPVPFLGELSSASADAFLHFLSQIRTNPEYLGTRLCALSASELGVFLHSQKGLEPFEPVLPVASRTNPRRTVSGTARHGVNDVERLLSFQRHDPLSILIHSCFANSSGPDGKEDQRRLDIWASALVKLISEPRSTSEQFLICVFNSWIMMRDWSGKRNLEWYLMRILAEGAFLLDRAEDQHGTRFNLADWNQTDEAAANDFYERSVSDLFELIDDADSTGIPDGLLELGGAVLGKLEGKYVENTSKWLVWRCLFFVFFLGVIVHPENHGMLAEYYITPYAREKILKKVAMKAYEHVSSMWSARPTAAPHQPAIPDHIKTHIERILCRFRDVDPSAKSSTPHLVSARSTASLEGNAEVQPFLVLCPADLSTLVNALFPERRPLSANSTGWHSLAPSISGASAFSQPISTVNTRNSLDAGSVLSTSASSVFSDSPHDASSKTVPEPYSSTAAEFDNQNRLNKYEDDGYKLRLALHELHRTLGVEATRGNCHPCSDRWTVLFVSPNGKELSYTLANDLDESNATSMTNIATPNGIDADENDNQIHDTVLQLLEDFEIPAALDASSNQSTFTYRASSMHNYSALRSTKDKLTKPSGRQSNGLSESSEDLLVKLLRAARTQAEAQSDYISAHRYWNTLNQLEQQFLSGSLGRPTLIDDLAKDPRMFIEKSSIAIDTFEAWLVWLRQSQQRLESSINRMMKRIRSTRDKMWYIADVRNSTEYAWSRDVCQALKFMGMPHRWGTNKKRTTSSSYLYCAENQVVDVIAAPEKLGGPNKLTDEQSGLTLSWLQQLGIENFCQGEERIHRFSCEIDKCINKLIGETIREAPVLWSSDLYKRDKVLYERVRARDKERGWVVDDASSVISETESKYNAGSRLQRPVSRDVRSSHGAGATQGGTDANRHIRSATPLSSILNAQRSFDRTSPVHAADSICTFWSPFHSNLSQSSMRGSPMSSVTNLSRPLSMESHSGTSTSRPGTAASSSETLGVHHAGDDKSKFLYELKQSLTGLLLSDLGTLVVAKGSETDIWFQGLGQECISRKEALEQHAQRKSALKDNMTASQPTKPRTLGKKKSFDNLRGANDSPAEDSPASTPRIGTGSRDTLNPPKQPAPRRSFTIDFPYKKVYTRLLSMLSVNPNPYQKLQSLRELEQLIIAAACSSHRRSKKAMTSAPSATRQTISEQVIEELVRLFKDVGIRPKSLFRDLQLIAAHVPPHILDRAETGRPFWNAGVAAMKLKAEVCRTMVEMADEVFAAHTHARSAAYNEEDTAAHVPSSTGTPPPPSTKYNLKDVGHMWTIAAREGYPTAQRELALFYLSNPESADRVVLPLSKPKEVFKQAVMDKFGRPQNGTAGGSSGASGATGGTRTGNGDAANTAEAQNKSKDVRNDPGLMCVAVHWMEAAERGGDELAISFLRQNEFMARA